MCCRPVPRLSTCDVPDRPRPHQQQTAATATMHNAPHVHAQPSPFPRFSLEHAKQVHLLD
ncbi:hypothetical protein COCCADRAFT_97867 [Bipolaris zeicola 26-R-13]|uniref:Uncharacterized protein n=1 Tax=Cochliobolus carbonum (strain 26-R-13) TaxID=930089 RepID=W6Y551_COCC2|nr:uncharacterized protein COCCADRAFT_97867 [Bipolaris zeicola 26-R-13]EUC32755.1 hypothetical protein COCCADRAFT_97867 [Bipolaris zeicola 26-R-13]